MEIPANSIVARAVVHGTKSVEIPATQNLSTIGSWVQKLAQTIRKVIRLNPRIARALMHG